MKAKNPTETSQMTAELSAIWDKSRKIRSEGNKLWSEGILEALGNVEIKWIFRDEDYDCQLGNGEIYKWDEVNK